MKAFRCVLRSSALAVGLVGCSQAPAPEPSAEVSMNVAIAPPVVEVPPIVVPATTPVRAAPPPKPEPPPVFPFPADAGGAAVAKVVTPDVTRPLPADRLAVAPQPRPVPPKVLDPQSPVATNYGLPPLLPPKPADPKPHAPAERLPFDLGARADALPAKPSLPVGAVVTERARDVNVPPAAPVLGRPLIDRVALDDPTSDLANAAIVSASVRVPPTVSGFVKVSVPDPFELGEQVKPKVPASAEPSAAPVTVNPQRVK